VLRTPLCELLGIEVPVVQASLGPWSSVELAAAVSNAGGLGTLGTALRSADQVLDQIDRTRRSTDRPFAVNLTARPFDRAVFETVLATRPAVVSYALGDPAELVAAAREAGSRFVQQVHTPAQARRAAELGVDVVVAQGGEAGGFGGTVSTMALVPQVVDAVGDTPVLAAGGIADGRGLAAALALGAQGVNIGTRFLAAAEAGIDESWQQAILEASSGDTVKVEFADAVFPPGGPGAFAVRPRVLRSAFVDRWNDDPDGVSLHASQLREQLLAAARDGRLHELVPFSGQTAGLIREVLPAAEIVRRLVEDARRALRRTALGSG
jgi:nitronate monooxygenase/enoyl-[acyl-carrier protein] reductase II